ncbi:hypothetical protein AACH10_06975 [Ideonella sp. DXS22W]|uniref:DUF721 domain-containing protein n=1 Tax=Pseudaquabacterium inlustre TaxID=2984192 RepID=A0ABU9CDL1_9BURK
MASQPPKPSPGSAPLPPGTRGIDQALAGNQALGSLMQRMRESEARLAAIRPLLPPPMRPHVKAGPIDEDGWTLLAGNPAVSAKLRQMLPTLMNRLQHSGFDARAVRVKLLSPT